MGEARTQLGWLEANLFIHPLFENDAHAPRCRAVLESVLAGAAEGWVDWITLHELSYVLPRVLPGRFTRRQDVCDYLLGYLTCETVFADDKDTMIDTLCLWAKATARFGDVRLAVLAERRKMAVCTVNASDVASVPNTYPG